MNILTGEFHHQIDEKGRIRIPSKFKEYMGTDPMVIRGPSGCLMLMPKAKGEALLSRIFSGDNLSENNRTRAMRIILSGVDYLEEDKQGRVQINSKLLAKVGIEKNIVTIGANDRAEIWSEEKWEEYLNDESQPDFDECLRSLSENV